MIFQTRSNIKNGSNGTFISAIAVAPGNSDVIWVGCNNGDVYSTTNGTTANPVWTRKDEGTPNLPNRTCSRIAIDPANSNIVYAAFGGFNSDNVYRSTDGGSTWANIAGGLPAAPVYSIVIAPFNSSLLYVGTDVGVFGSANTGVTWSPANEGPANVSVWDLFWAQDYLFAATHGRGAYRILLGLPVITSQPASELVSVGGSATFCVVATGVMPQSFAWQRNGVLITGATQSCYTITNVQPSDSGNQFSCVVSNSFGYTTSSIADVTVVSAPLITVQPQNQLLLDFGGIATFSVSALGQAPLSYQWMLNGTSLSGASTSNLTVTNVQSANAGDYEVVVTNTLGSVTSSLALLSIASPPTSSNNPSSPPGFIARTVQIDYPGADAVGIMDSVSNMEMALGPVTTNQTEGGRVPSAGLFVDPLTGVYCANVANFSATDANGCFFVLGYINMDIAGTTAQDGDFTSSNGVTGWPKSVFPGIPGLSVNNPNTTEFAVSFTAYVYLQAGVTEFGVDSDDGFLLTLTSGSNPNDAFGRVNIGEFNGARGWSDSIMEVSVPSNGAYALRLDYEQGGGGASCELFTVVDGVKILVNDTNTPGSLLAYPTPEVYAEPYAVQVSPKPGQIGVPIGSQLNVQLQDGVPTTVNTNSIVLKLNGVTIVPTISQSESALPNGKQIGNLTTIAYTLTPGSLLSLGNTAEFVFADSKGNLTDRLWTFTNEPTLSVSNANTNVNASPNNSGFMVYPWHTSAGQPNDIEVWTEEQILGWMGPNYATLTDWPNSQNKQTENAILGPQGWGFIYTNYINWDISGPANGAGDFTSPNYPKQEFPGLIIGNYSDESGFPTTDGNNFSMLVETWLDFPVHPRSSCLE